MSDGFDIKSSLTGGYDLARRDEFTIALAVWLKRSGQPIPVDLAMDLQQYQIPQSTLDRTQRILEQYDLISLMMAEDVIEELEEAGIETPDDVVDAIKQMHSLLDPNAKE